MVSQEDNSG